MEIYLDWAATAVSDPDICKKIYEYSVEFFGNPSSIHTAGQKASRLLEDSRQKCATALGVRKEEVIFTSGGTESNNMVLLSLLRKPSRGTVIISAIEHPAVLEPAVVLTEAGYKVKYIKPEPDGIINCQTLQKALTEDTRLVAVMAVNNETGAIQPIKELAALTQRFASQSGKKIHFHCDAVQGTGKVEIDFSDTNINSFSISGHKLQGPRGTGILILKNTILPVVRGGGQESGYRPGTENTAAIYGLSLALEKSLADLKSNHQKASTLMDNLIDNLHKKPEYKLIPATRTAGDKKYSPYILSLAVPPVPAEVMARILDDRGICTGTGSACSNRKKSQSKTLEAMNIAPDISFSRIRVSIGCLTTQEELEIFIKVLAEESEKLLRTLR